MSRFGPIPLGNVVVVELGLGLALVVLAIDRSLWWVGLLVLLVAVVLAGIRWQGRWLLGWARVSVRYAVRSHGRSVVPPETTGDAADAPNVADAAPDAVAQPERSVVGPQDQRVALLRLLLPDLVVAKGADHERRAVGLAWHEGNWTAVLQVDADASLVSPVGGPSLPLGALAPCLEDRGVVLDAIQVLWHCYPGSAALPSASPALNSYLEVLGPLPAAARRTTWIAVRFDPQRCLGAVQERGGGVVGSHRALIGALSRVRSALAARGVTTRPLDPDELLRAGISAAEFAGMSGAGRQIALRERWAGVTAGGVGHSSYAITGWPANLGSQNLNALTGVRALSTTVSLTLSPAGEGAEVGLRGLVRVSARNPAELESAETMLQAVADGLGLALTPLRGQQAAGLAATMPLGASA